MPRHGRDLTWLYATVRAVPVLSVWGELVTEKKMAQTAGELRPVKEGDLELPRTQQQNLPFLQLAKAEGYLVHVTPKVGAWQFKLTVRRGGAPRARA
jgi:hypothetical protein